MGTVGACLAPRTAPPTSPTAGAGHERSSSRRWGPVHVGIRGRFPGQCTWLHLQADRGVEEDVVP